MYRLTITVLADDRGQTATAFTSLADKLEQVAEDLRHNPAYGSFGAYGAHGCNLYYRIQAEDDLDDELLSVRPIILAR